MARFLTQIVMENDTLDSTDAVAAGSGAETAETAIIETNEATTELEGANSDIEQGVADVEVLEDLAEQVGDTVEGGGDGIDEVTAGVVETALESALKRYPNIKRTKIATESFGNKSSRRNRTIALENSITDGIKKIWKMILDGLDRLKTMIVNAFNKYFGAAEKLEKRAKALTARAENTKGTAKEKKIESSIADKLKVGGNANGIAAGIAAVEALTKTSLGGGFDAIESEMEEIVNELDKVLEKPEDFVTGFELVKFQDAVGTHDADPKALGHSEAGDNLVFVTTDELPGNRAINGYAAKQVIKGAEGIKAFRQAKLGVSAYNVKSNKEVTEFATLSVADAEKVAASVAEIAGNLKAFRNKVAKLDKIQGKAVKAARAMESKAEKETDSAKSKGLLEAGKVAQRSVAIVTEMPVSFSAYALNVSKYALDAVELSLKQYSEEK